MAFHFLTSLKLSIFDGGIPVNNLESLDIWRELFFIALYFNRKEPPDCHKAVFRNPQTGAFISDSYYYAFPHFSGKKRKGRFDESNLYCSL